MTAKGTEKMETQILEVTDFMGLIENFPTLIHYSAASGMLKLTESLVKCGYDIDNLDAMGWTPLMQATRNGHTDIIKLLLESGANPQLLNQYGADLLKLAIASGNISTVNFILSLSIQPNKHTDNLNDISNLALASVYGFEDLLELFLEKEIDNVDIQVGKSGMTPVMLAVSAEHVSIVKSLVKCETNTRIKNIAGKNALDLASVLENKKLQKLLGCSTPFTPLYLKKFIFPETKNDSSSEGLSQSYPCSSVCQRQLLSPHSSRFHDFKDYTSPCKVQLFSHKHPSNQNTCISPKTTRIKNTKSPKDYLSKCRLWLKPSRKRSKSEGKSPMNNQDEFSNDNLLEHILKKEKLLDYWPTLKEQEVTLRTFLTMDDEDLISIGITKVAARKKLLKIILHYKRILFSYDP